MDLYRADMSAVSNTHARQACRRYWYRAIIETISERSMSPMPLPRRITKGEFAACHAIPDHLRHLVRGHGPRDIVKDHVKRFEPFWRGVSDEQLWTLHDYLTPYFKRKENRHTRLDQ